MFPHLTLNDFIKVIIPVNQLYLWFYLLSDICKMNIDDNIRFSSYLLSFHDLFGSIINAASSITISYIASSISDLLIDELVFFVWSATISGTPLWYGSVLSYLSFLLYSVRVVDYVINSIINNASLTLIEHIRF